MFCLLELIVATIDGLIHSPKQTIVILLIGVVATVGIVAYKANQPRPIPVRKETVKDKAIELKESLVDKIRARKP